MLYNVDIVSDICKVHGINAQIRLEIRVSLDMLMYNKVSIEYVK